MISEAEITFLEKTIIHLVNGKNEVQEREKKEISFVLDEEAFSEKYIVGYPWSEYRNNMWIFLT